MGLLDDAIREHLELKRRRGANATELARQEQEAFGPPRRGEFDVAPSGNGGEEQATFEPIQPPEEAAAPTTLHAVEDPGIHEHIGAHEDEPQLQDEPPRPHGDPADVLLHEEPTGQPTRAFDAAEIRAATQPDPEPEPEAEPELHEPEPEPIREAPRAVEPAPAAEPPPVAPVREPEPDPETSPAPTTPAAARPDEGDDEGEAEDVLEETPEFLQETPEHDRLWFEQRPPRDFDF
jgi:hypothetical protein